MTDTDQILLDSVERLLSRHFAPAEMRAISPGAWQAEAWAAIEELGLPLLLVGEDNGGFGIETTSALQVVRVAGCFGAPVPIAETMLANWLCDRAGLAPLEGPLSVSADGLTGRRVDGGLHVTGALARVPWGRDVDTIVALAEVDGAWVVVALPVAGLIVTEGENLASLPRDDVRVDSVVAVERFAAVPAGFGPRQVEAAGAAMRTLQIAGALETVLSMTITYLGDRKQFGAPLGSFQVLQHDAARLAEQVAAAGGAAEIVTDAFDKIAILSIAIGKARAGEAASIGAGIAHQLHGAIGFTRELSLSHFTKSLWSWREEFGSELVWQRQIAEKALGTPADDLWPLICAMDS